MYHMGEWNGQVLQIPYGTTYPYNFKIRSKRTGQMKGIVKHRCFQISCSRARKIQKLLYFITVFTAFNNTEPGIVPQNK